jgi:cytochrome oxidase assembly protein ShyY1
MKKVIRRRVSLLTILLIVFTVTPVFAALGSWTYHLFAVNISV